jgi:hypothetical protein
MDEFKFRDSKELGIGAGDDNFMMQFERNLALERLPEIQMQSQTRFVFSVVGISALFVIALMLSKPMWIPYVVYYRSMVDIALASVGLTMGWAFMILGGVSAGAVVLITQGDAVASVMEEIV